MIFDGSEIPFEVTFMACIVILFLKALKSLINTIKIFVYLKKSGMITDKNKEENSFRRIQIKESIIQQIKGSIILFLIAGWFLANLIYVYIGGN